MYQFKIPRIHQEGFIFVGIFFIISLLLSYICSYLGYLGFILTAWCLAFFRDPNRVVPLNKNFIVSLADGQICNIIENVALPKELAMSNSPSWTRISVFLNIFNVHVNRIPIGGTIIKNVYHQGKFVNASLDKASDENERQILAVETEDKQKIIFVQIAGLIARRIRCDVHMHDKVNTGQRFGLIRFGSRCDIYIPQAIVPKVIIGQKVIGGETVLADLSDKTSKPLTGVVY